MENIDGIVKLLKKYDTTNFGRLFDVANKKSGVDLLAKIADGKTTKTKNCIIKYNKDIQGVEIKTGDYDICVCKIEDYEFKELSCGGDDIRFAYIKSHEDGEFVEYDYNLTSDGKNFELMPTITKQGYSRPRCSHTLPLTDEDITILKGETPLTV